MFNQAKLVLALGAVLASSSAMAISDNTITFKGEISTETCEIAINGSTAKPVVLLPTVSSTLLDVSGKTAGATSFDISLTNCPVAASDTKISTVFVGNSVTANGNLGNTGTAGNVEIQILNPTDGVINLSSDYNNNDDITVAAGATEGSATYTAQYYASGAASAGTVESTLQYAISYQ